MCTEILVLVLIELLRYLGLYRFDISVDRSTVISTRVLRHLGLFILMYLWTEVLVLVLIEVLRYLGLYPIMHLWTEILVSVLYSTGAPGSFRFNVSVDRSTGIVVIEVLRYLVFSFKYICGPKYRYQY